jgi:uncharacterized protein (DUF2249 family)
MRLAMEASRSFEFIDALQIHLLSMPCAPHPKQKHDVIFSLIDTTKTGE